jgi:two-component system sensor histidine kinase YesM
LHYEIDVDPELNGMFIPKLLLQPVVENAMIHGIEPKRGLSTISICVRSLGEQGMQITVEDNGIGMTVERLSQVRENINPQRNRDNFVNTSEHDRSSIGLLNVSQRIELFYGSSYGMEVTSREGWGTVVRLVIEKNRDGGDHIVQSIDRG